jgi:hypothetical protein
MCNRCPKFSQDNLLLIEKTSNFDFNDFYRERGSLMITSLEAEQSSFRPLKEVILWVLNHQFISFRIFSIDFTILFKDQNASEKVKRIENTKNKIPTFFIILKQYLT